MGLFDTIVKGVSDYLGSDDGNELIDNFRGFLSEDDSGSDGADDGGGIGGFLDSFLGDSEQGEGGGGGFGRFVNSFLGDAEEGEGDGADEGGWGGTFGRIVDRLSGDGGREDLWDRALDTVIDRVSPHLPTEVRNVAGQLFGQAGQGGQSGQSGQASVWNGSLTDSTQTDVPNGWHAVANHPTAGHRVGEGGFPWRLFRDPNDSDGDGVDDRISYANTGPFSNDYLDSDDDGMRYIRAPGIEPGQPLGHDGSPDPRVTMPHDVLDRSRLVDVDGDGRPDLRLPTPADAPGQRRHVDIDTDGDGAPDLRVDLPGDALGRDRFLRTDESDPNAHQRVQGDGYDDRADYDDMVTSGAGPAESRFQVPDDPTFPVDDPAPAAVSGPAPVPVEPPVVEASAGDFEQSIDDADQVDQSMDGMFDGVEGA